MAPQLMATKLPVVTQPAVIQSVIIPPVTTIPTGQSGRSNLLNQPSQGGLDPNIIALINILEKVNWKTRGGYLTQERELSLIRLTEFLERETEDDLNDIIES